MNLGNPELGSATLFHHSLFPEALLLELSQGFCPVLFLSGHILARSLREELQLLPSLLSITAPLVPQGCGATNEAKISMNFLKKCPLRFHRGKAPKSLFAIPNRALFGVPRSRAVLQPPAVPCELLLRSQNHP